jgi:hypothetical protein
MINFGQGLFTQIFNKITKTTRSILGFTDKVGPVGKYQIEHYDKDGNLKGIIDIPNGIVTVGKNSLLDVYFRNQTQIAAWYFWLIMLRSLLLLLVTLCHRTLVGLRTMIMMKLTVFNGLPELRLLVPLLTARRQHSPLMRLPR